MKCQILFPGKNKKNISKCCLLKILPRVRNVKSIVNCNGLVVNRFLVVKPFKDLPIYLC